MADPSRSRQSGEAYQTGLVEVLPGSVLDPAYQLELLSRWEITPTSWLKVFTLTPRDPTSGLPGFIGRWDERADTLDVDITNVDDDVKEWFRQGRRDYAGHHPARTKPRGFDVDLRIPGTEVFRGVVSFGLSRALTLPMTFAVRRGSP